MTTPLNRQKQYTLQTYEQNIDDYLCCSLCRECMSLINCSLKGTKCGAYKKDVKQ